MSEYMQFEFSKYAAYFLVALISLAIIRRRRDSASKLPLPPGPPRLPIIGNLLQMPLSHLWEKGAEWGKQYGDLVFIENVGTPMLIVNSYEAASALLDTRSLIYSSRTPMVMSHELQGWGWATSLLAYGETLRKHRAFLHRFFQTPEALNYFELQERETCIMLNGLLNTPENYANHIQRLPGAVILRNVYGYEVQEINDPFVLLGGDVQRTAADSLRYFFLDFVPWLKYLPEWFPGATFPRKAREGRELMESFRFRPHEMAKKEFNDGSGKECMTSILLSENLLEDGSFSDEKVICDAGSTAYLGGSDTSVSAIMIFVLAMLKYPKQQRRAQDEIDRVIGSDRLPNSSDKDSLPYVQAICTEIFRWEIILPLGVAHTLTEDDEYMGYHIPAGTVVLPNAWAMSQDATRYPDPLSFKPERWIEGGTKEGIPSVRPQDYAFGFGRRVCSGQNWAEHIVFLAVASILAAFNIEKAIGPDGVPIPPNDSFVPSIIRSLGPSQCKITPRSEKVASLIQQAVASI